jgi:hypothetical protein
MWKDINPIESSDDSKKKLPGGIFTPKSNFLIGID